MRKTTISVPWEFKEPNTTQSYWYQQPERRFQTGARWCGSHGIVMEICKVDVVHELIPALNSDAEVQDWGPGGYWLQAQPAEAENVAAFVVHTIQLTIGGWSSQSVVKELSQVHPDIIFSGKVITEGVAGAGSAVFIPTTREEKTLSDMTDGIGNGMLIASPYLMTSAWTVYGTQNKQADDAAHKWLTPPITANTTNAGKSHLIIWYKYREVDYSTWTGLMQSQSVTKNL